MNTLIFIDYPVPEGTVAEVYNSPLNAILPTHLDSTDTLMIIC